MSWVLVLADSQGRGKLPILWDLGVKIQCHLLVASLHLQALLEQPTAEPSCTRHPEPSCTRHPQTLCPKLESQRRTSSRNAHAHTQADAWAPVFARLSCFRLTWPFTLIARIFYSKLCLQATLPAQRPPRPRDASLPCQPQPPPLPLWSLQAASWVSTTHFLSPLRTTEVCTLLISKQGRDIFFVFPTALSFCYSGPLFSLPHAQ